MTDHTSIITSTIRTKLISARDSGDIVNIRYTDSKGVTTNRSCLIDEVKDTLIIIITNGGYRSFKIANIGAVN